MRVRKVTVSTGKISTIAGTGGNGWNGDGIQASSAQLNGGYGVALDTSGTHFIKLIYFLSNIEYFHTLSR